jgi:hypothetical protein
LLGDSGADPWLARLAWEQPGSCRVLELPRLDSDAVGDVLARMGAPLSLLAERPEIVDRLWRLSEGEPLLLSYYAQDLWGTGDAVVRMTARPASGEARCSMRRGLPRAATIAGVGHTIMSAPSRASPVSRERSVFTAKS